MSFDRIVVGVDFSSSVNQAAVWVHNHFATKAQLTLVTAVEPTQVPRFLRHRFASDADRLEADLHSASARVEDLIEQLGLSRATPMARAGKPHEVLNDVAQEIEATLIVIGSHGPVVRPWLRLGSTAERLLRRSGTSLLIGRGEMRAAPARLLLAADDADITPLLLARAVSLRNQFGARLLAVHVLSNAAFSHMASMEAARAPSEEIAHRRLAEDIRAEASQWLHELAAGGADPGDLNVEVPHGAPGDEILAAADRFGADLIVIGRYGLGRVIPAVLGSVLGSVAHGARCPVLVVMER
jgi:nucleotide-binding universal stress UspA family protein